MLIICYAAEQIKWSAAINNFIFPVLHQHAILPLADVTFLSGQASSHNFYKNCLVLMEKISGTWPDFNNAFDQLAAMFDSFEIHTKGIIIFIKLPVHSHQLVVAGLSYSHDAASTVYFLSFRVLLSPLAPDTRPSKSN